MRKAVLDAMTNKYSEDNVRLLQKLSTLTPEDSMLPILMKMYALDSKKTRDAF